MKSDGGHQYNTQERGPLPRIRFATHLHGPVEGEGGYNTQLRPLLTGDEDFVVPIANIP